MAGGRNRFGVPRRYRIDFVVQDRTKKNTLVQISLDEDRFAEAVDFAQRLAEDGWWEIYDRHHHKVVASYKTHGKKGQDGQGQH